MDQNPSTRALDVGAKLASKCGEELIILTVAPEVHVPAFQPPGVGYMSTYIESYKEHVKEEYTHALKMAENRISPTPSLRHKEVLLEGNPASMILEEAERRDVGLIVMGSRGLGGVSSWLLGSTSHRVVNECKRSVLIVK